MEMGAIEPEVLPRGPFDWLSGVFTQEELLLIRAIMVYLHVDRMTIGEAIRWLVLVRMMNGKL